VTPGLGQERQTRYARFAKPEAAVRSGDFSCCSGARGVRCRGSRSSTFALQADGLYGQRQSSLFPMRGQPADRPGRRRPSGSSRSAGSHRQDGCSWHSWQDRSKRTEGPGRCRRSKRPARRPGHYRRRRFDRGHRRARTRRTRRTRGTRRRTRRPAGARWSPGRPGASRFNRPSWTSGPGERAVRVRLHLQPRRGGRRARSRRHLRYERRTDPRHHACPWYQRDSGRECR
jgi:hypothetical protein